MKLLIKSNSKGSRLKSNGVKISKTVISLKGGACKKLTIFSELKENQDVYGSLGFDDNGKLCVFVTYYKRQNFLKIYEHNKTKDYFVISISKNNQDAIQPFLGSYEIGDVGIASINDNVIKGELIKQ